MCGVLGIVTTAGRNLSVGEQSILNMRDLMRHRGPDGEGLWLNHHIALAHRRLSIVDIEHGQQPFHLGAPNSSKHQVLSYNGEIYNHLSLRKELAMRGVQFDSHSDTETLAKAWACWGRGCLTKLRGMFAFAVYEAKSQKVTLVRDPMGIKPLYYAMVHTHQGPEIIFASEPLSILAHPSFSAQPDWVTVSSYLTTIRTTLGRRSMYEGVNVLLPGELVDIDLSDNYPKLSSQFWYRGATSSSILSLEEAIEQTHSVVTDSIDSHLLSDVVNGTLFSGGLDSTIITSRTLDHIPNLKTWCTGAMPADTASIRDDQLCDVEHAAMAANTLGVNHHTVPMSHSQFNELWPWMIKQTGLPLSTPNQISIYQVSKSLSKHAKVVLSGEGADEIFAGYDAQLMPFAHYLQGAQRRQNDLSPLDFYLHMTSWVPVQLKGNLLNPKVFKEAHQDSPLIQELQKIFGQQDPKQYSLAHMMMAQRQYNLTGLLERLDSSTMLASVEGRTPFSDVRVSEFADQLPMSYHFAVNKNFDSVISKQLLRKAFAYRVPDHVNNRPKASFPLPFQAWMAEQGLLMARSSLTKEIFSREAVALVSQQTDQHWALAWPMLNISLWLDSVWGSQAVLKAA